MKFIKEMDQFNIQMFLFLLLSNSMFGQNLNPKNMIKKTYYIAEITSSRCSVKQCIYSRKIESQSKPTC
jgi:hypothetical protein